MFIYFAPPLIIMPELPEVETIVRQLNVTVKGKIVSQVKIRDYARNIEGNLTQKALAKKTSMP